jgi:hypothetical protein
MLRWLRSLRKPYGVRDVLGHMQGSLRNSMKVLEALLAAVWQTHPKTRLKDFRSSEIKEAVDVLSSPLTNMSGPLNVHPIPDVEPTDKATIEGIAALLDPEYRNRIKATKDAHKIVAYLRRIGQLHSV